MARNLPIFGIKAVASRAHLRYNKRRSEVLHLPAVTIPTIRTIKTIPTIRTIRTIPSIRTIKTISTIRTIRTIRTI